MINCQSGVKIKQVVGYRQEEISSQDESDESSRDENIKDILDEGSDDDGNNERKGLQKLMKITKAIKKQKVKK